MKSRPCSASAVAAVLLLAFLPGTAFAKSHRHADSADAVPSPHRKLHGQAASAESLARLAARQKAAWREHLAKLRDKPRAERIALKRHDRKFAKLQQQTEPQDLAALARAQKRAWREHLAKIADLGPRKRRLMRQHDARVAAAQAAPTQNRPPRAASARPQGRRTTVPLVREAQTAARQIAARRPKASPALTAHQVRLARRQAAQQAQTAKAQAQHQAALARHQALIAQQQAVRTARLQAQQRLAAQRALNHQLRVAKQQAAHNARIAARNAHRVALQGDGSGGRSIKFWQTEAQGVPVKAITVDLNDSDVKVSAVMALKGNGTSEPFRQMIERANPNVAVTGTFFSLDNLYPVGDIVIDGSLVHFGGMGTALCVTPGNRAEMVTCTWGRHHDWSPYDFVVACGPRLLQRGRVVLDPHGERFRDRHMLAPNSRIAVGITPGNKIVFAMTHKPISLGLLAKVMRSLGVSEAMNLDAGTSTGFYYNGATLAKPGRKLTNMIVVYGRKDRYERALDQLVPPSYRRHADARRQAARLPVQ